MSDESNLAWFEPGFWEVEFVEHQEVPWFGRHGWWRTWIALWCEQYQYDREAIDIGFSIDIGGEG